ncbi:MAG: phosphoenolpyruvate synthase [Candidatus Komeilibacteria bacterium]|nr:phosphoenolpyruvate synthase [Candidatus Komeilibacteria bacterium]
MKNILWFSELNIKDIPKVGGKNASLGEMYQKLTKRGIIVPNGFAISSSAYFKFLKVTKIDVKIKKILTGLNTSAMKDLAKRGGAVRQLILAAEFPADLKKEITGAYQQLCRKYHKIDLDVAVRSSATAEDLPDASFAGQQESYLNITGEHGLLEAVKKCMASLFTDRAISYRVDKHYNHFKIGLSVGVQKMVRSDLASSGVMFSIHTETGFKNAVVINASWGLGEYVVKGVVTPDEYLVFKPMLKHGFKSIIGKELGSKKLKLVYSTGGTKSTQELEVPLNDQNKYVLTDAEILQLAKWACLIEEHYKKPMDIEWAKDGRDKKLYIVQARPETVESRSNPNIIETYILEKPARRSLGVGGKGKILLEGAAVGKKIGQGKVKVIEDVSKLNLFKDGEVLVAEMTDPDWEPIMKHASAIITDAGGRTCHAAIVSRELGIPCVVGTGKATEVLTNGQMVTVSGTEGEVGRVYQGLVPFKIKRDNIKNLRRPKRVKVMMNVGNPEAAFSESFIPNDGVGLAREEFIISNFIKIHPLALINYQKIKKSKNQENQEVIKQIDGLTAAYSNKVQFYIDKLAYGIGRIAGAFWPKDVIVRLSDFKTNEYAGLIGGSLYEPKEDNPMLGWRGASRYYDSKYVAGFNLECLAFKKAREEMGLTNIKIMVPFCRTVLEGQKVLKIMAEHGLKRGVKGLEVYVMCEIPSNVILGKEFCKIFDGFSIGSNDLTQLTLGVDRDSRLVAHVYDEKNEAVKELIRQIIKTAHQYKRKVGICGQAPSDFPDFAQFLVRSGIDSISLIPDTVISTTVKIAQAEKH